MTVSFSWFAPFVLAASFVLSTGRAQTVAKVAAGGRHSVYVTADGSLWAMGYNFYGQLGDGTFVNRSTPVLIATGVAGAEVGDFHTMFVKSDGTLWGMGANGKGELGLGLTGVRSTPVQIAAGVTAVAAGHYTTYFVKTDGTLWAVGDNDNGQLGDGTTATRLTPVQVASGVTAVAAGTYHAAFLKSDGTLWTMGSNSFGELGDGTRASRSTPAQVASGVTALAAGSQATLFLKADGSLWAAGLNSAGELGEGGGTNRLTPIEIGTNVKSLAAGAYHAVYTTADGTLWGMGYNSEGQLGDSITPHRSPAFPLATEVAEVAAGFGHTLFIRTDGTLWGAGANQYGELGYAIPTVPTPRSPVQIVPEVVPPGVMVASVGTPSTFTEGQNAASQPVAVAAALRLVANRPHIISAKVSLGGNRSASEDELAFPGFIAASGRIEGTYDRSNGVLTLVATEGIATVAEWQAALRSVTYTNTSHTPNAAARSIAFVVNNGLSNSVPVTQTLDLEARNDAPTDILLSSHAINPRGGMNALVGTLSASDVDHLAFTYSLVAGEGATHNGLFNISGAALRANNPAMAEGPYVVRVQVDDGSGGTWAKSLTLTVTPASDHAASKVEAGEFFTNFITSDGTLWEVGLGGPFLPTPVAYQVATVNTGGGRQTAFVKNDGGLWVYGINTFGHDPSAPPMQVATNVAGVAVAGYALASLDGPVDPPTYRTFFIKTDATLWAVGRNPHGEFGDGTTTDRTTPVQVATGVASVASGNDHTVFLKTDGTLWAMGSNWTGQLGDATTTQRTLPVPVASNVMAVAAGGVHTLFITRDGTLWGTGGNLGGQLGDGTTTSRTTPVRIASGVASVAAGSEHSLFVKTDGTLWAMGANGVGQLGDGTTTTRTSPVLVASGVATASGGHSHSNFIKTDGTLWAMGSNAFGQLGDGSRIQRLAPVQLLNVAAIVAQPTSQAPAPGQTITLTAAASSTLPLTYQWSRNGRPMASETNSTLALTDVQPMTTGLYAAEANAGGATTEPAIVGLTSTAKVVGAADEFQADIFVPANGNTIDQVLLRGNAAAITADHALGQITRISFIDLSDDIVQVEMSGPGTLAVVLDGAGTPAPPVNYNQAIPYMKGHAGIVITGATEATHVAIFTVGRATSVNTPLFKDSVTYDGVADLAFIAILSANGKFGGVRTANASYFATKGLTGLYAPNVEFTGPVYLGDITAADTAIPVIIVGRVAEARITGGDLRQANGRPLKISGLTALKFTAGQDSHGRPLPAAANRGILVENGVNVTARVVGPDAQR